ncbi:MAG: HU family DNA-binding protein [Bacteroidaceae bacterium]|nr:HU family DNA-binding protein [Bacteroidaceae bacterium]
MAIDYEFYESPAIKGKEGKSYHPRVVTFGKVTTEKLAQEIQYESSLTRADVKAVLTSLADKLADHLADGRKIHLEGIGYLSVSLRCDKEIHNHEDMKRAPVAFKAVNFRADEELKKKLRRAKMERSTIRLHSMTLTNEEIDAKLAEHFATHDTITRRQLQHLCLLRESTALRHIHRLVEEGKLRNVATLRNPVYMEVKSEESNRDEMV